jgi:hypothetical protein
VNTASFSPRQYAAFAQGAAKMAAMGFPAADCQQGHSCQSYPECKNAEQVKDTCHSGSCSYLHKVLPDKGRYNTFQK